MFINFLLYSVKSNSITSASPVRRGCDERHLPETIFVLWKVKHETYRAQSSSNIRQHWVRAHSFRFFPECFSSSPPLAHEKASSYFMSHARRTYQHDFFEIPPLPAGFVAGWGERKARRKHFRIVLGSGEFFSNLLPGPALSDLRVCVRAYQASFLIIFLILLAGCGNRFSCWIFLFAFCCSHSSRRRAVRWCALRNSRNITKGGEEEDSLRMSMWCKDVFWKKK